MDPKARLSGLNIQHHEFGGRTASEEIAAFTAHRIGGEPDRTDLWDAQNGGQLWQTALLD